MTANKQFFANVKLMGGSAVLDETGKQISLTSDERLGIVNAAGGPITQTNPVVSLDKHNQDLDALRAGLKWRDPVDTVTATAPASPVVGARYLNSTDNKIYTCKTAGNWGTGEVPEANWAIFVQDSDEEYTYDADTSHWVMKSSGSIPYASTEVPGKVELAESGETAPGKVVQGNDARLAFIKGSYSATLNNPTGTVTVTHNLGTAKIFVQAWSSGEQVELQLSRNVADATNKLDVSVNGTPSAVEIYIIALP